MPDMERIRVYFDADDALRLALKQIALDRGVSVSSLIEGVLAERFPEELSAAQKKLADRGDAAAPPAKKKRRPPKSPRT